MTKLRDSEGNLIHQGRRKTFIVCSLTSAKSILAISRSLLSRGSNSFSYVMSYRFSQDALEMFFSKTRGRLGWNNNPNALQFKHAIRALLLRNNVEAPNTANCSTALNDLPEGTNDVIDDTTFNDKSQTIDSAVHALLNTSTNWRFDALYYISGYIAKKWLPQ